MTSNDKKMLEQGKRFKGIPVEGVVTKENLALYFDNLNKAKAFANDMGKGSYVQDLKSGQNVYTAKKIRIAMKDIKRTAEIIVNVEGKPDKRGWMKTIITTQSKQQGYPESETYIQKKDNVKLLSIDNLKAELNKWNKGNNLFYNGRPIENINTLINALNDVHNRRAGRVASDEKSIAKDFARAVGKKDSSLSGKKISYDEDEHKVFAINHGSWSYNNPAIDKLCDAFERKYRGYYFTMQGGSSGGAKFSVPIP
jgi:hypothetical protein